MSNGSSGPIIAWNRQKPMPEAARVGITSFLALQCPRIADLASEQRLSDYEGSHAGGERLGVLPEDPVRVEGVHVHATRENRGRHRPADRHRLRADQLLGLDRVGEPRLEVRYEQSRLVHDVPEPQKWLSSTNGVSFRECLRPESNWKQPSATGVRQGEVWLPCGYGGSSHPLPRLAHGSAVRLPGAGAEAGAKPRPAVVRPRLAPCCRGWSLGSVSPAAPRAEPNCHGSRLDRTASMKSRASGMSTRLHHTVEMNS